MTSQILWTGNMDNSQFHFDEETEIILAGYPLISGVVFKNVKFKSDGGLVMFQTCQFANCDLTELSDAIADGCHFRECELAPIVFQGEI